jgi:hypothetical protein
MKNFVLNLNNKLQTVLLAYRVNLTKSKSVLMNISEEIVTELYVIADL